MKHFGSLDLDYEPMEYKSILPDKAAIVTLNEAEAVPYADPSNESLSDSLMERFENMETDETMRLACKSDKNDTVGVLCLTIYIYN